jgi:sucrose phosphorylase
VDTSIVEKVAFLYPGEAAEAYGRLRRTLDEFKTRFSPVPARSPLFSERDSILICYADHVRTRGERTLETLHRFLDEYVKGVIPAVHILPFYPYSSDDGFSVVDYYQVKKEFGEWDDVDRIADDFDLMVDLVINHVSASSGWFQGFLAGRPPHTEYFLAFDSPVDVASVFRPRTHPLLTRFDTSGGEMYVWTTFSADQIDVDFSNPDVLLEYISILLFYIAHGATIIRLDAIAFLWKELGSRSIHLPQTHMVVKLLRQILEEVAPNVWVITETNVPHQENISYFGAGDDEAHFVYNFALPPLLLYTFLRGDATRLSHWAKSLSLSSPRTAFFNFTASHDGIGVTALREMIREGEFQAVVEAVKRRGGRVSYRSVPGADPIAYELNITYLDAVGGPAPFIASQAIALALQGVPGVYFGSIVGAENWEEGVESLGYNRAINRQKFDDADLRAELSDPGSVKHRVYRRYRELLLARSREPLFNPATPQAVLDLDPAVFAVKRSEGDSAIVAMANVTDRSAALDGGRLSQELGGHRVRNLLTGGDVALDRGLELAPYGVMWLGEADVGRVRS